MPAGDGTGPTGTGPMTGRGAGFCAGNATPGFANPVPGRGRGRGFGRGQGGGGRGRHGWRHQFHATGQPLWARDEVATAGALGTAATPADEVQALKNQAGNLEAMLNQLRQRISALEPASGQS